MRRALIFALVAASIAASAAMSGDPPTPGRRPPTPAAMLLQPVAPIVRAWRWNAAQRAIDEGRPEDALEALRLIEALTPEDPHAALFRAHVVGRDLASLETSSEGRFARIVEALGILSRAESASRSRDLALETGAFLLEGWTGDPELYERFERRFRGSPTALAAAALGRAVDGAPRDGRTSGRRAEAWRLYGEARRLRGIERIAREGDWTRATEDLRAASGAFLPAEKDLASAALASAWGRFAAAAMANEPGGMSSSATELVGVLRVVEKAGGAGLAETLLAASILSRLIELGAERLSSGNPRAALSLAEAADSIRGFVDTESLVQKAGLVREILSRTAVVRLLEGVKSSDASLAGDADRVLASLLRPFDR